MAVLKVPSLQHLARNWHPDSQLIRARLVQLARNSPTFNYRPLFSAARDMLMFGQPLHEVEEGMRRSVRRPDVLKNFLSVLPMIESRFRETTPSFVQGVERRFYPVGRDLLVPFDPPMIYGVSGEICFPWFSFWRSNPLTGRNLSLFVTLVDDVLLQDPDLEEARFEILDFSAPSAGRDRELKVINAQEISRVTKTEKEEMLSVFAEGFAQAKNDMSTSSSSAETDDTEPTWMDHHPDLFD